MKHASLLIALCVLFSLPAIAQSTTTVEKNANRITITTKKTDENGKTITETYIAEGDEPSRILQEMAIHPELIQKVEVTEEIPAENVERLFLYRNAGDKVVIEGLLNENINEDIRVITNAEGENEIEKVIIINRSSDDGKPACIKSKSAFMREGDHAFVYAYGGHERKSNCAAMGVYVNNDGEQGGSRINSLINHGGAQEAGLLAGDVIVKIAEYEVTDFESLHEALSNFRPGDVVTVRYIRDDKKLRARVTLKDWAELPGHEWRSRSDCGKPADITEEGTEDLKIDDPDGFTNSLQPLQLQEVRMYPNPTDGLFALSFSIDPGPFSVAITDINGKVIYSENSENTDGRYTRDIDLKNVPTGNYVLTVKQGDKVYTDQISKQ